MLAIIGGSGLAALDSLVISRRSDVHTPYGEPSSALTFGSLAGRTVIFLARHGDGHTLPPHEINYRANIWALHAHGITDVVAVATVGGIREDLGPGVISVPDQIIDYTHSRASTYFTRADRGVGHIDFTQPYSEQLRAACRLGAERACVPVVYGGVYAATQGPRLETAAEINRLERDGADMVGMTGMPEAALSREIGLRYATIAVVANHAAGRGRSRDGISMEEIGQVQGLAMAKVRLILEMLVETHGS